MIFVRNMMFLGGLILAACGDNALDQASDGPPAIAGESDAGGANAAGKPTRLYPGPCVEIADNRIDGRPEVLTRHQYDSQNRRTRLTHDTFADGFVDYAQTFEYSNNGRRRVEEIDSHGNGIIDVRTSIDFDDAGNELSWSYDKDADGSIDQLRRSQYENGFLVEVISTRAGDPERRSLYTRDADGHATLELRYSADTLTRRVERDYQGGRLATQKNDTDGDGSIDQFIEYSYGDDQQSVFYDQDNDGTHDSSEHQWFDEEGRLTRHSLDFDGDQLFDWTEERYYGIRGLAEQHVDETGDGSTDYVVRFERNERGQATRAELDRGIDGNPEAIDHTRYDIAGNITSMTRDSDGDGTGDALYEYRYTCFR